jgi:transcriptional regulator with XRE-family HTH domain
MASSLPRRRSVSSGVEQLDRLLNGLWIGDNVIWYDHAGSLASVFCLNFLESSRVSGKPLIYVTFDRSPRNLLEKLGPLAEYQGLTILDCFTWGKGAGSEVFSSFYEGGDTEWPCRVVDVREPHDTMRVVESLYGAHSALEGDVRFIFESLTGMQDLWGSEEAMARFYSHSCPRLYELNTVAYWVIEKEAHSQRLRAHINQIAQVVIDLSIKRGRTSLSVLKAERRNLEKLDRPHEYWVRDLNVSFEETRGTSGSVDLGHRLKDARGKRRISQSELAKLIGVTPSTISQIESNLIYPSLPALMKMAEVLGTEPGWFFPSKADVKPRVVFPGYEAAETRLTNKPEKGLRASSLMPEQVSGRVQPYLIEIPPRKKLTSHFLVHKGDEMGYVLSGRLHVTIEKSEYKLRSGDLVYLTTEIPSQWRNPGSSVARLLWLKLT